jgi:outer membrane immunogenic protein
MNRILVAGIAAAAIYCAPAIAADMPVKAPLAPPMFSWTGFYVGGTAGYGWGDTLQLDPGGQSHTHAWDGFVGGGTAGVNWQSGSWVLGIETDFSGSDIKASWSTQPGWGCVTPNGCTNKVEWFGTTRGRVGYAFDRLLPYATIGVAYGRVHGQFGAGCVAACNTSTETGLTYGGGVEWAFAPNWSAKIEYLRVDLGRTSFQSPGGGDPLALGKPEFNVVRVGLNYKFGDWGKSPVVAKY